MNDRPTETSIQDRLSDSGLILHALNAGARAALTRHKLLGQSIVVDRGHGVETIEAKDIPYSWTDLEDPGGSAAEPPSGGIAGTAAEPTRKPERRTPRMVKQPLT